LKQSGARAARCALLAAAALLQRAAARRAGSGAPLLALAVTAHARLLAALAPPAGTAAQPLTLAALQVLPFL